MKKQEAVNREKDYEKTKRVNKEKKQSARFHVFILYLIAFIAVPFISIAQGNRLWATYYGGLNPDHGNGTTTDAAGNVYLAGYTVSDSGIASGGFQNTYGGNGDAFLVKFDAAGNRLWATYYGGSGYDNGACVTTDAAGNVYLAGYTNSTSGIASNGFQNTFGGTPYDAFLVKFDASGNRLWATYFGGSDNEQVSGVVTDSTGNVYIAGSTMSDNGIATPGSFQNTLAGDYDGYLAKFNSAGNLPWATYYGAAGQEECYDVTADNSGNIYLSGFTRSYTGMASGGFQNTFGGGTRDCFLVKFNGNGNRLWATYYGGLDYDRAFSVATDLAENVYIAGWSKSNNGIASGGFKNTKPANESEVFIAKFNAGGNRLWATYYGGPVSASVENVSCATDGSGNVFLTGEANVTTGIASGGFQNSYGGEYDIFLAEFDSAGNRLCATYYGGSLRDICCSVTVDPSGNAYMAGYTWSSAGISSSGSFQDSCFCDYSMGRYDAFLAKFSPCGSILTVMDTTNTVCSGPCSGTAAVTASGGTSPYTYLWSNNQTTQTATGLCAGSYTVTVTDSAGKAATVIAIISGSGGTLQAAVTISGSPNPVCGGTVANFTATAVNGGTSPFYQWKVNGKNAGVNSNTYADSTFLNNDVVTCTLFSNAACVSSSPVFSNEVIVKVNPAAVAGTVAAPKDTICEGTPAILNVTGNSTGIQWQSSLAPSGFTNIAAATNVSYTGIISQDTYFRVYTSDGNCADTSASYRIIVKHSPVAGFSFTVTGKHAEFTNSSSDASGYVWNFDDGSPESTDENPSHYFPSDDIFHVCLQAFNGSSCSFTVCRDILIGTDAVFDFSKQSNWQIFPVPAKNEINIRAGSTTGIECVELYDVLGKKRWSKNYSGIKTNGWQMDVSDMAAGIYILKIKTDREYFIQTIAKQ